MLIGAAALPEPAIIGDVEQPSRPVARAGDPPGKDRFIANERGNGRRAAQRQGCRSCSWREAARNCNEPPETQGLEPILERKVFAIRHEMSLVIDSANLAAADHEEAVIDTRPAQSRLQR